MWLAMRLEYCTSLWRLRFGAQSSIRAALALAAAGLPLMLLPNLPAVLTGMVLVGIGTFFAQACATGFVGQAARDARGIASGSYLASYFLGGLTGSAVLGRLFDQFGWPACLAGIAASLLAACLLSARLTDAEAHSAHFNQAVP
jgi:predicted MFS family arabinose efflux permease